VDGANQTGAAAFTGAVNDRATVSQVWVVDLAGAVAHTLKLVGTETVAGANFRVYADNTAFTITILPRL
jgi:hypothetical protein